MKLAFKHKIIVSHGLIGATIGVIVLHPVNGMVDWVVNGDNAQDILSFWPYMLQSLDRVFSVSMLPMTGVFAFIGAVIGVGFGLYHANAVENNHKLDFLENELAKELPAVIAQGEGETLEFKSSLRWDLERARANRALEAVVAKTIAGLMNHRGGSLLIGVADNGAILGLLQDYATLKHRNQDGFERCLIDLVKFRLGGDKCSSIHCIFYEIESKDICRVIVEPKSDPVYYQDGKMTKYYIRTGNGTRELDIREALAHVATRKI